MNEIKEKKDVLTNAGLMLLAGVMIYWLGPSWNLFLAAPIIEKLFYALFSLVIIINLGIILKKIFFKKTGKISFFRKKDGTADMEPKNDEEQVSAIMRQINQEIQEVSSASSDDTGKQLLGQMKNQINNFDTNLDKEADVLEKQYEEMNKLRNEINRNVGDMYSEYKTLERQMRIVDTMIKTRKLLGERTKPKKS